MNSKTFLHPDLHLHSSVSDGSDTPLQLLQRVRETDIDIFALTDHDTYHGCQQIARALQPGDPVFLGGVEFSCRDKGGKYHVLGYCYNLNKPDIVQAVQYTHDNRLRKVTDRLRFLEESRGFTFTDEERQALFANENPGKPHIVKLMIKKGYVKDRDEGFAVLKEFRDTDRALTPAQAIDAILQADGIPVLAHGILADGSKNLSDEEIGERVQRLKECGLMGLECYYSGYTDAQRDTMLRLAQQHHLMVTAGSDYHGKNKTVQLGQSGGADPQRMQPFYRAVRLLLGF